jgi:hypothetical protein
MALKIVNAKITEFTLITNSKDLLEYANNAWDEGSESTMFGDPKITTAFYASGTAAIGALELAQTNHKDAPTVTNQNIVDDKMALLVIWLTSYSNQVVVIANAPTNCTTREEAATNIGIAGLTAEKLTKTAKEAPIKNVLTGGNTGTGTATVEIVPNPLFGPKSTTFFAVSKAPVTTPVTPDAVVTLANGQISIVASYVYHFVFLSIDGKGRSATFKTLIPAQGYNAYSFSKNGNKLIGALPLLPLVIFG